jgi:hypothetical protein
MGIHDNEVIFLTQEEKEIFLLSQMQVSEEAEDTKQRAFENAIMEVHMKYNLRSKKTDESSPKKVTEMKKVVETKKPHEPSTETKKGNRNQESGRNQETPLIIPIIGIRVGPSREV